MPITSWKKFETQLDITKLKANMSLIKFLGEGHPVYPVPMNDPNYKTYLIESHIPGEIGLKDAELGHGPVPSSIGNIHISLLHKTFESLIDDACWWYLQTE